MEALSKYAADGGPVVGICNGFQVLTEAGLLPGALQKNRGLRFLCTTVGVRVCTSRTVLTRGVAVGSELVLPINHFEGNFTCDPATLERLRAEDRVVLRYNANPNGSVDDIAGVCNEEGNVVGLMPHPERACDAMTGGTDGLGLLQSLMRVGHPPRPGPGLEGVGLLLLPGLLLLLLGGPRRRRRSSRARPTSLPRSRACLAPAPSLLRVMSARESTACATPAARQAWYSMPLRCP